MIQTYNVAQDNDHALVSLTCFKKVADEFKQRARENKFVVRDFAYDEEQLKSGKNELTKLHTDKKKQFGPLVRWLKVNFGECFTAWIHVKVITENIHVSSHQFGFEGTSCIC